MEMKWPKRLCYVIRNPGIFVSIKKNLNVKGQEGQKNCDHNSFKIVHLIFSMDIEIIKFIHYAK